MVFEFSDRLSKIQLATFIATALSEFILFLAVLTPAWQVADDTDVGRSIASGLWIYCPGTGVQCWYIFSDSLINYYERADVCRFLLIGDCRKKLLRTPYFFGWHYAVLAIMLIVLSLGVVCIISLSLGYLKRHLRRITTVVLVATMSFNILLISIGLAVFVANAEMLESRYLIGVKNTFEKHYGYSFFLACFSLFIMLFGLMLAIFLATTVFLTKQVEQHISLVEETNFDPMTNYLREQSSSQYFESPKIETFNEGNIPRYCQHSPSVVSSMPARTFINYQ